MAQRAESIPIVSRRGWSARRRREAIAGVLWASPWLIGFFLFTFGSMLASLARSFAAFSLSYMGPRFVAFDNFVRARSGADHLFWPSLTRTLQYALVMVPVGIGGSLLAAMLLNQGLQLTTLFRTLFFLPSLTPVS